METNNSENTMQPNIFADYTVSGVLLYLHKEWQSFEAQRNEWQIERLELKTTIDYQFKTIKNLEIQNDDASKRLKILEHAIKSKGINDLKNLSTEKISSKSIKINRERKSHQEKILKSCLEEIDNISLHLPLKLQVEQTTREISPVSEKKETLITNQENIKKTPLLRKGEIENMKEFSTDKETIQQPPTIELDNKILDLKEDSDMKKLKYKFDSIKKSFSKKKSKSKTIQKNFFEENTENEELNKFQNINNINEIKESELENKNMNIDVSPLTWKVKYIFRGHLDSVSEICFLDENMLASASYDGTIKLWCFKNKKRDQGYKEIVPSMVFRGHTSSVNTLCKTPDNKYICSGGSDKNMIVWKIPSDEIEGDHSISRPIFPSKLLKDHKDIIWKTKMNNNIDDPLLVSVSGDSDFKIWNIDKEDSLLETISNTGKNHKAVDIEFLSIDSTKLFCAFDNGKIDIYDLNTSKTSSSFESSEESLSRLNQIKLHNTTSLIFKAYETGEIILLDTRTGKNVHTMTAHVNGVSALDADEKSMIFATGGYEACIRWWDLRSYDCVQEFATHRSKSSQAVLDVKFHSDLNLFASSGADSVVKLYTNK